MLETLTHSLQAVVAGVAEVCIPLVQLVGVAVLMLSAIRGVIDYAQRKPHVGVTLAHGLALALEFMLGAEVLPQGALAAHARNFRALSDLQISQRHGNIPFLSNNPG